MNDTPGPHETVATAATKPARRRLRPEQRREQLLDALLVLVTHEGFGAVSMESLARAGGIAKTVVYNAFGDLDGALAALYTREQERVRAAIDALVPVPPFDASPAAVALQALHGLLDDVEARPDSWRLLLVPSPGTPPAVRDSIEGHRQAIVAELLPAVAWVLGELDAEVLDHELVAYTVVATVEHAARLLLEQPEAFDRARIVRFVVDLARLLHVRFQAPHR